MAFCNRDDVIARLSLAGVNNQSDDADSSGDDDAVIDTAIEWADSQISLYVERWFDPPSQLEGNAFLKFVAVALACYWIATRKAEECSDTILRDRDDAIAQLGMIASGKLRIPNCTYPGESELRRKRYGLPRVAKQR